MVCIFVKVTPNYLKVLIGLNVVFSPGEDANGCVDVDDRMKPLYIDEDSEGVNCKRYNGKLYCGAELKNYESIPSWMLGKLTE